MVWRNRLEAADLPRVVTVAPGDLSAALAGAVGGEFFLLEPGAHGPVGLKNRKFPRPVVIDGPGAVLETVKFEACEGIDLRNVTMTGHYEAVSISLGLCRWMAVRGCTAKSLRMTGVAGFVMEGNSVSGADGEGDEGVGICVGSGSSSGRVLRNTVRDCRNDHVKLQGSISHIAVELNRLIDFSPTPSQAEVHKDAIQLYGTAGGTPHHILLRRNIIRDVPGLRNNEDGDQWPDVPQRNHPQGIFVSKYPGTPRFAHVVIEENLIDVGKRWGLHFSAPGEGCRIRRNTLMPTGTRGLGDIYLEAAEGDVELVDNIAPRVTVEANAATAKVAGNRAYGADGIFPQWAGLPADGIPIAAAGIPDAIGATAWLRRLAA